MRWALSTIGSFAVLGFAGMAHAQSAAPAREGFQIDVRTGFALPMGNFSKDLKLADLTTGQVPVITDIGAKVLPELFVGGYLGVAFGGEAGTAKAACNLNGGGCTSLGFLLGLEAQYHFLPGGSVNPWLGYGIGVESIGLTPGNNGGDTATASGFQFARLMGGADFRINRVFGVGPFVDFSLGKYSTVSGGTAGSDSRDIPETAVHEWLTLGARFVFFP
ncbi:MAG: hypothetical protein WDO69_04975 [Pseudomonadota bacterium]